MSTPNRVLVTGGAGFIGSHAVEYYAHQGAEVTALDNLSRGETLSADDSRNTAAYNWEYLGDEYPDVERIKADIRDAERLETIAEDHDAIVHTAGQVAVTASLEDPRTDFR